MPCAGIRLQHALVGAFDFVIVQRLFQAIAQAVLAKIAAQFGVVSGGYILDRSAQGYNRAKILRHAQCARRRYFADKYRTT
ncbi:hypothetical protein D3C75_1136400 [compost metagenome]